MIEVDSNYISFEPMKSKEEGELIRVYQCIIDRLAQRGIKPKRQILDNEAPKRYLQTIKRNGIEWELVPPHNHRRNLGEKAIQIGKSHIISNLVGCDPSFPIREWHRLLPQMEITVNTLQPANATPTVSAHMYVKGIHSYNKEPLAPLGCSSQCYVRPDERTSFEPNSLDTWCIVTSTNHYRCHNAFIKNTKLVRKTDMIIFHHKYITQPMVSSADVIVHAAAKITEALKDNAPTNLTTCSIKDLERLANTFHQISMQTSETQIASPRVQNT
jgi:hypothetical protein